MNKNLNDEIDLDNEIDKLESIEFVAEDGEKIDFYLIDEACINDISYLLVSPNPGEPDCEVMILKTIKEEGDIIEYESLEDEKEIEAILKVFEEQLECTGIEFEI